MNKLKALIFDVDGTLADTERDGHRPAFNQAFADFGLDWQWSEELYGKLLCVGGGKERMQHFVDTHHPDIPERWQSAEALASLIQQLHERKTKYYIEMVQGGKIAFRPGVLRLLREARSAGLLLAIATTTSPSNVRYLLEQSPIDGLADWFSVVAAGDVVPQKKPAPDIYLYALQQLGLPADACLAFEDSGIGTLSARQAGLPVLVTENGYTTGQDFSGALVVVDHLGEVDQPLSVIQGSAIEQPLIDVPLLHCLCA